MALQETTDIRERVREEERVNETFIAKEKWRLFDLLIIFAKRKRLILDCTGGAAALSVVITLLLPTYYTGTARILPPQQNQSIATAMLGQLGPLIGATAGKELGLHNPNDLYVGMLHSRSLEDALIDKFSLMSVYKKKKRDEARQKLESLSLIISGKDSLISISVEDRSAERAAEIANAYVEQLENITNSLAVTDAAKQRLFFEREMKTAGVELANAELALKKIQESTGIIQLDSQSKVMLESYANLRAQIAAKEVEVQAMRSFAAPENPDLTRAQQELAALRSQAARFERGKIGDPSSDVSLANVPRAGLEYVRGLREVKYRETLLELLTKQYEIARIDEAKDASLIQVLDRAIPPESKSWPHRGFMVILFTLFAFLLAIVWSLLSEFLQTAKQDPEYALRMHMLKAYMSGDGSRKSR
ncbi:MAG TPA: Wzz/FepE/Etk N-terminal domain-containing protein [Candidatus Angelobacter sp.]|jgi:uncharacterized protein involved in exopolysaccharide biosynthesis